MFIIIKKKLPKRRSIQIKMAYLKADTTGYNLFIRYMLSRIRLNKNNLCICTGPTGSGKSYSNLRLCQDADDTFDIKKVSFGPEQFMAIINSGELKGKGAAMVYDEAGVSFNARNWHSISNKMLNYFLQTCRSNNQILFFNAPDISFLDAGARKLFHIHLETAGIDHTRKEVILKPLCLQVAQGSGKVYKKYLKVKVFKGYGGVKKVKRIRVPLPDKELLAAYEEKKKGFVNQLNQEIYESIKQGNKKPLTEQQQKWYDLFQLGLSTEEIAEKLGINTRSSFSLKRFIRNKGYFLGKSS